MCRSAQVSQSPPSLAPVLVFCRVRTLPTPSSVPVTVSTRSCTPGTTLLTPALTPVASRRSATFLPALPMMTPASFELTRARTVNCAAAALPSLGDEMDAAPTPAGMAFTLPSDEAVAPPCCSGLVTAWAWSAETSVGAGTGTVSTDMTAGGWMSRELCRRL